MKLGNGTQSYATELPDDLIRTMEQSILPGESDDIFFRSDGPEREIARKFGFLVMLHKRVSNRNFIADLGYSEFGAIERG